MPGATLLVVSDCSLCRLIADPTSDPLLIHQNSAAVAVIHDDWATRGHAMIVAREHVENASSLSDDVARAFFETLRRVESALLEVFAADRVFMMKLGVAVPHLHVHLYPVTRSATRDDFLRAVTMQSRDEPEAEEKAKLIERLRARL